MTTSKCTGRAPFAVEPWLNRAQPRRNDSRKIRLSMRQVLRWLKIVLGFALLPIGVIMLALPGPGWLTIALALAILAGEFVWARNLLDRLKATAKNLDPRKKSNEAGLT